MLGGCHSQFYIEGKKTWAQSASLKGCVPVEVMQLAKFLNGAFVVAWHLIGFLVNTVAQALHEKPIACTFMYFVVLAI